MRFRLIITAWIVLVTVTVEGQTTEPMAVEASSLVDKAQPLDRIAQVFAPPVDQVATAAEDDLRRQRGLPVRFAIGNAVSMRPETHGTWETIDDTLLWRLRVSSPGALSLNLGFTHYLMPVGGRLSIHSADGSYVLPPFTDMQNATHGELWTPIIPADDIVVEVTIPVSARRMLGLELGTINVGYRGLGSALSQGGVAAAASGSCNVDVVCPEGDDWRDQIPAVGVYTVNGSWTCTGSMINNTAQDARPYFLTADHCGVSSGNAASVTVYWNYENSTCRPPGSPASGGSGNGSLSQFQSGAYFRADYSPSDMTLIELDSAPDPTWNISFAGWDNTSADASSAIAIHHPNTDEKRISFEYDPTTTTTYLQNAVPGNGTHIRITDWDLGTTEPGSSGSPLFNQDHRIIGQLHGGYASCTSQTSDWYGRFSVSWNGGGSNATRLSNWLDPGNTGATVLDVLSGAGLSVAPGDDVLHVGNVGGPFTNPSVTYTLSNPSSNPIDYSVSLAASFGMLLDGGTGPVTGTLAGGGDSVDVVVTLGSAIDALPAGLYLEEILFDDLTNGLTKTRQHTFEIGFTTFGVTPTAGFDTGGPVGGPFPGSAVYTVISDRPTPVTVEIAASEPWISLNGGTGPVTLYLDGTGTSDTVTVAISSDADALSSGIYGGSVTFANLSGGTGDTARPVTLDVGRIVFPSSDTPLAIPDQGTAVSTIHLADGFCVGDVNVDVDITHTYIGDLTIDLISPSGTVVRLHNRSGGSSNDIVRAYDDEGVSPDGPGTLADFDFESAAGDWTLVVTDHAGGDTGTLNSWALRLAPVGGVCPTPVVAFSFPLDTDPGWIVEGQWAFGQPTGQGSGNGDPTAGYTGSYVYGYNLAGDYPSSMPAVEYLTTNAIDCTRLTGTRLRFRRWLGVESSSFDHADVEVSADGSNWTTVWAHTATTAINESSWSLNSYNISAVADGAATVYIRWGMGPTDTSVTYAGWNIDDIEITGVVEETDCNGNGIPDSEEISGGLVPDCNLNAFPDECDVASGASLDANENGIPDECECPSAGASPPDAGPSAVSMNRYLSFAEGDAGLDQAVRVTFVDLPGSFSAWNGVAMWVGLPAEVSENGGSVAPVGGFSNFNVATLGCAPIFADWNAFGEVYVYHEGVVPGGTYAIQTVNSQCPTTDGPSLSDALTVTAGRWADVVGPYDVGQQAWTAPDGTVDVAVDIVAVLDKFASAPGAPGKARVDLEPSIVDRVIDITDVTRGLDAFGGESYPFPAGLQPCVP